MDKHPRVIVYIGGRPYLIDCDCGGCEPRSPIYGGVVVLAVAAAAYILLALAVF
jgi:hypothetical protein